MFSDCWKEEQSIVYDAVKANKALKEGAVVSRRKRRFDI